MLDYLSGIVPAYRPSFVVCLLPFWIKSVFTYAVGRIVGHPLPGRAYNIWALVDAPVACKDKCGHIFDFGPDSAYWTKTISGYEPSFQMITSLVRDGDICVDVGANVGLLAVHMAQRAGLVIAIEPEPRNLKRLFHNRDLNHLQNLRIVPAVASNREGTEFLNTSTLSGYHSMVYRPPGFKTSLEVRAITLKRLLKDYAIEAIGFLKIDVEGAEAMVLEGLGEWLTPNRIRTMLIEVWTGNSRLVDVFRLKWSKVKEVADYGTSKDYLVTN